MALEQCQDRRMSRRRGRSQHRNDVERRILVEQRHGVGRRAQNRRVSEILVLVERRITLHRRTSEQRRSGVTRRDSMRRDGYERRESDQGGGARGTFAEDPATRN